MKKVIIIFGAVLMLSACTSKDKTDSSTETTDTSGYKEQPQDETKMNDTIPTPNPDTAQLHPDTIQH